ncbi:MAG TPA: tRNA 2-selenouridine(34) synthase MnmH [Bacteroidales bacterium]|jgi:tRNA 2-selenouridine synthase|nr:tRNA 2-selenouridine(34) synthase MnmH [Bacteroidales bacterium]
MNRAGISEFLDLAKTFPVIDVRSPLEFSSGHIPGAVNIPLFTDEERAIVGTKYAKEGHIDAIIEGIKLSGPSMHLKLKQAISIAANRKLLVHCWRGGMRSEAMAWLFSMADMDCTVLEGGYKTYRHHVLETLAAERRMIVLGGMTGSGKTDILKYLSETGRQVIDLERLANHKGSAFGSLGQPPQPSTEQFENDLFNQLQGTDSGSPVWIEDESRNIGTVFLNEGFFNNMQKSTTVVLLMDIPARMPRLLKEYSAYQPDILKASIMKVSRRMGGDRAKEAAEAVDAGNMARAIEILLNYYDKTYRHSIERKANPKIIYIETDSDDVAGNAKMILHAAGI